MRFSAFSITAAVLLSLPRWVVADSPAINSSAIDLTPGNFPPVSIADAVDSVREGTHFVSRTGRMYHSPNGQTALFVFDNSDATPVRGPMIVLPNLNLMSMESVKPMKVSSVEFRVSGTVTEYKDRNYILIDDAQTTLIPPPVATATAPGASPPQAAAAPTSAPLSPAQPPSTPVPKMGESANQTMDRLLAPMPGAGAELPTVIDAVPARNLASGPAAIAPDAPVLQVVREGTHLINRIGRLNHNPAGTQAFFTFDSDGKTMADPPMVILPNLKLASMEGAVQGKAGDIHFRVSGTVTEYKGRNCILLDKAVAVADVETQF